MILPSDLLLPNFAPGVLPSGRGYRPHAALDIDLTPSRAARLLEPAAGKQHPPHRGVVSAQGQVQEVSFLSSSIDNTRWPEPLSPPTMLGGFSISSKPFRISSRFEAHAATGRRYATA